MFGRPTPIEPPALLSWLPPISFTALVSGVRASLLPRASYSFSAPDAPPSAAAATPAAGRTTRAAAPPPLPPPPPPPPPAVDVEMFEAAPFAATTASRYSSQAFASRILDLSAGLTSLSVGGAHGGGVLSRAEDALRALEVACAPVFDPEEEARLVMRSFTGEEDERVGAIFSAADASEELSYIEGNHFTVAEARELRPRIWLTDGTINVFLLSLRALGEASLAKGAAAAHRRCWVHNTFFWAKLQGETGKYVYEGVKTWTRAKKGKRGVDLFAYNSVLVPINRNRVHWALALIDVKARTVCFLDSLRGDGSDVIKSLCRYMHDEYKDKHNGEALPGKPFTGMPPPPRLPRQYNGVDCGAFLCIYCELLVRGVKPSIDIFTQEDIDRLRQRILLTCAGQGGVPRVLDAE